MPTVIPDPTYCTVEEFKAETMLPTPDSLNTEVITKLLKRAESQIDNFCGKQKHHPDDEDNLRLFPREDDEDEFGNPEIPLAVFEATILQVEFLYTQWSSSGTSSTQMPEQHQVSRFAVGGDGSYSEDRAAGGKDDAAAQLCAAARAKLTNYRRRSGRMLLSDASPMRLPRSSRERL